VILNCSVVFELICELRILCIWLVSLCIWRECGERLMVRSKLVCGGVELICCMVLVKMVMFRLMIRLVFFVMLMNFIGGMRWFLWFSWVNVL